MRVADCPRVPAFREMSWNPFGRVGMSSVANVASWCAAGGLAVWWQMRDNADSNKAVFSSLDAAEWNARKKAAMAAAGAAADPSSEGRAGR